MGVPGISPPGSVVVFDYRPTRSGDEILKKYLSNYTGYVQTDGYVGYEMLNELSVKHAGCWAHVRRKFVEVVQAVDKARTGSIPPRGLLGTAMNYALKQWARLTVYLQDPHVGLDNNAAENAIRHNAGGLPETYAVTPGPE